MRPLVPPPQLQVSLPRTFAYFKGSCKDQCKALAKAGLTVDDIDLWEINEAFAMVTMLAIREVGIDPDKVNIYGGACAQGHPIGSTGSRLIVTLVHALKRQGLTRGIAALCIGGGEAVAMAIEV